jgi:hypothetical protein
LYKIPQCYEEGKLELADVTLNLYDPKLFKPVVPAQFMAREGECDTNYFHISTLYYKRRACTYSIDMIKYGTEFSPLNEPSRQDCLFRLGCCYEDNEQVLQQYPFMPRCYHRVKNEIIDTRLHEMELVYLTGDYHKKTTNYAAQRVCGKAAINTYIAKFTATATLAATIKSEFTTLTAIAATTEGLEHLAAVNKQAKVSGGDFLSTVTGGTDATLCLYKRKDAYETIKLDATLGRTNFWANFDVFDKKYIINTQVAQENIPESLRGLMVDLF